MSKKFFGQYISAISTKDADDEFAFHNFSGEHSASNPYTSAYLYEIIVNNFNSKNGNNKKMCDVGAANGFFTQEFQIHGWDAYGIDGCDYGWRQDKLHIDKSKYCILICVNL